MTERAFQVCAEQGCSRCNSILLGRVVPDDCEYEILHVLEKKEEKGWRKRQSGKSTYLRELAARLSNSFDVYYIMPKIEMWKRMEQIFRMRGLDEARMKKIHFIAVTQMRYGILRGRGPGLVILDEVRPGEVEEYLNPPDCYPIVAAMWT